MGQLLTYKQRRKLLIKTLSYVSEDIISIWLKWLQTNLERRIHVKNLSGNPKRSNSSWRRTKTLLFWLGAFFSTTQPTAALKCPDPSFCDITKWPPHPASNRLGQWETSLCVQKVFIGFASISKTPQSQTITEGTNEENVRKLSNQSKPAYGANLPFSGPASAHPPYTLTGSIGGWWLQTQAPHHDPNAFLN